jgi:hypothetical protein
MTNNRAALIELHIEELVLEGFPESARYRIGAAVEQELARLLRAHGHPASWPRSAEMDRVNGGSFDVPVNTSPEAAGRELGRAIHRSLTPSPARGHKS